MAKGKAAKEKPSKGKQAPKSKREPIKSWDEWFRACGEIFRDAERYEGYVQKWEQARHGAHSVEAESAFADRHDRSFWKRQPFLSARQIRTVVIAAAIGLVVGFVIGIILSLVGGHAFDIASGIPFGIVGLLIGAVAGFLPGFLRCRSLQSKMAAMEPDLADVLRYVPPKYRNSFCLEAIGDMWASYGVGSFDRAVDVLDKHIRNNRNVYSGITILFDVPVKTGGPDGSREGDAPKDGSAGGPDLSAPGLPSDIESHILEGVEDPEVELDKLIGMERVKTEVRRMKNRVEFFGDAKSAGNGGNHLVFLGSAGTGKALADDTLIPVADERGYVPIGDLVVGDMVFDEGGNPTKVLGVYHQGVLPAFRVTLVDNTSLVCNDQHMFAVRRQKSHSNDGKYCDMNVHQMMTEGVVNPDGVGDRRRRVKFWIPMNGALVRDEIELPLDPYVLGVLIGDGCLTFNNSPALTVSSNDEAVVAEVANRLHAKAVKIHEKNYSWQFDCGDSSMSLKPGCSNVRYISLKYMAETTGLTEVFGKYSHEKRIPEIYFKGSIEQRFALLQGLMDTDGFVNGGHRMRACYSTSSEGLAHDVIKLVTSLGMRATLGVVERGRYRKGARTEYTVRIKCPFEMRSDLFLRSPKRDRCLEMLASREVCKFNRQYNDVGIESIEPLGEDVSMTCIYVDSPSHLYQAGEQHIVTHNTITARIVTRILYDFGYIRENRMIEVDGEYLKSAYVGQTGERTSAIVQAAKGGVLFVDEAYLLYDEKANNSVGKEATGVLLKAMEDDRDDLVVILAGYEDGINRLIASNEGFASRIKHKIYFDDYTADELGQIFKLFLTQGTQTVHDIDNAAYDMLVAHFDMERKLPGFGNAREARNALDKLLDIHADRYMDGHVSENDKMRITVGDAEEFLASERERLSIDSRNFMATSHLDESIMSLSELKSRTKDGAADPDAALDFLVGMNEAKEEIRGFLRRAKFFEEQNMTDEGMNLNVVFLGEPGTGKSTCAGIVTGYLYKAGYIRENKYVDVTGDFLKASYVGQTGKRTEAVIEYSKGMVLFIDEAYLLDTAGSGGHDFGAEALGVLVNAMEKAQGELVVILAGYEAEMNEMLERNPGMKSRIGTTIHLSDYTPKELCAIYKRIAKLKGFDVDRNVYQPMASYMVPKMGTRSFGNARFVRQLVDDCISAHADRYAAGKVTEEWVRVLSLEDLQLVISKRGD